MLSLNYLISILQIVSCLSDFENINVKFDNYLRPDEPDLHMLDDSNYQGHEHYDDFGQHYSEYDHDLVTGSHEYSQKFKELDPEEAKLQLGKLFHKIDIDNDLKIDKEELKVLFKAFFTYHIHSVIFLYVFISSLDLEASKPRFKEYDANGDGQVAWSEYTNKIYGYTAQELEDFRKDSKNDTKLFIQSLDEEKLKFDSADQDKTGYLNETEFVAFEHPHNYRHMAPYELKHTLRDFDKDKDGFINELEYLADGFDKTAADETEHLFNETDKDKDGLLTKEEVLDQHDLWVGSQATDYGRHLENLPKDEL
ncbi:uncharacterized protein DC041_0011479 [Schistosoma bovis]|uniref:Reticulocalbin-3 n=1 Tax=Schistosoma bovis TaxID=6184 RepID=A0A430Q8U2_SCHBO|nr:uncharacterized protein DC041_0011479 [Schistosoma bovis]